MCPFHASEVREWHGQSCGQAGWGPGHRIPNGVTVALMDETVRSIRAACANGTGCSETPKPARCMSRDRCETPTPQGWDKV